MRGGQDLPRLGDHWSGLGPDADECRARLGAQWMPLRDRHPFKRDSKLSWDLCGCSVSRRAISAELYTTFGCRWMISAVVSTRKPLNSGHGHYRAQVCTHDVLTDCGGCSLGLSCSLRCWSARTAPEVLLRPVEFPVVPSCFAEAGGSPIHARMHLDAIPSTCAVRSPAEFSVVEPLSSGAINGSEDAGSDAWRSLARFEARSLASASRSSLSVLVKAILRN